MLTTITLSGRVSFDLGSARLTDEGKRILDDIWNAVAEYPERHVYIEGHTDDIPIDERYRYMFRSNWELATARANAVLHYLLDDLGADPARLSAVGYGEYQPVAENSSPDNRAENRRVVISVRGEERIRR